MRNFRAVLVIVGVALNTIFCSLPIIALAFLKLLLPTRSIRVILTRSIMAMGEFWVSVNARMLALVNNTEWHFRGAEELSPDKWYLVIANHQTWVDIVVLQTLLNRRVPFLKFFIKQELIWLPVLGICWWAMDMPFMKRYSKSYLAQHPEKKGRDFEATRKACEKFRNTPTSVINFIEGTRFSSEKQKKRASKFDYLLPPRAGGMALALASMGDMFDAILDVTVVYPDGQMPEFWGLCRGELKSVVVEIRQRPIEDWMLRGDYGGDREFRSRFHKWLTNIWHEKDARIAEIHARHSGRPG